jgi:two-component system, NarL family, nitrate/nitrite response regulator NarL
MTLRVLLVEDDSGTRQALQAGLAVAGLDVIAAFHRGEPAIEAVTTLRPDVALVDLGLPGMSGVECLRGLRDRLPDLPVLVHTVFEDPAIIVQAIEAGATGYLLKGAPLDEVCNALQQVCDGLSPISPAVARHLLARVRDPQEKPERPQLSTRELEVLELLVRGHAYADVAGALGLKLPTVQTHVRSIYRKLEVASKAEATYVALRTGLVEPD